LTKLVKEEKALCIHNIPRERKDGLPTRGDTMERAGGWMERIWKEAGHEAKGIWTGVMSGVMDADGGIGIKRRHRSTSWHRSWGAKSTAARYDEW
jgi:hypothetical protein